jgi:hypothetical protein
MAIVPVAPPLTNYYTVNDSSPGSQVWDLAAGAFVALSDATFNSWLSQLANAPVGQPYYPFYLIIQSAASSDAGTTTTFQVDNTSIMTTGAKYNISGTGLYDGNRTITVVDGTHVKIPVAFAGNATGNLAGAAIIDFMATLAGLVERTAAGNWAGIAAFSGISTASDINMTGLTIAKSYSISLSTSGKKVTLVNYALPTSPPIGEPVRFINNGANAFDIYDFGTIDRIVTVQPGDTATIIGRGFGSQGTLFAIAAPGVPVNVIDGGTGASKFNVCRMYLNNNQAGNTAGTWTKVAVDTVDFDADSISDTTNHRIKPNVAGTFMVSVSVLIDLSGAPTVMSENFVAVYKNGSRVRFAGPNLATSNTEPGVFTLSDIIQMNGSTDYLEVWANSTATGGVTWQATAGQVVTWLSCVRVGP